MSSLLAAIKMLQMGILVLALLGLSSARICPDGDMCVNSNTCCRNSTGGYGCCPLPYAECCSDHVHCCYERTVCDLVHSKCVNKTVSLPWMRRLPTRPALRLQLEETVKAVICPDQESECPDGTTCCQLLDSSWGCCPLAKAVCCEDKLHCCPGGTKCDVAHSKCVSSSLESFPMLEKLPARRRDNTSAPPVGSVSCPGGRSSCPDSCTCCLLSSGDYGCCPYTQAMCCSDHLHCCPSGTICDLEHGVCRSGEPSAPLKKTAAEPDDVKCPDEKSACLDQTTCCKMTDDTYGCCPMPNAICCSDHIHCCPEGTKCDVVHGACVSAHGETTTKTPAAVTTPVEVQRRVGAVPCDRSVACADGNTCCKSSEGEWACCPLPKAVCCEDHQHCCPHGTVCDLAASTCVDPSGVAWLWLSKVPAFPLPTGNAKCDESTSCPGKSTCCRTESGGWACCPLPQAVCCDDHLHCCPHDTVCNLEAETCDDPSGVLPSLRWVAKESALTSEAEKEPSRAVSGPPQPARNMCDAQTSCPRDTTCCFMDKTHQWGCCPLPKAVCCDDGNHCCPSGHTCEPHRASCSKGPHVVVPWSSKLDAMSEASSAVADVKCDDKSSCASGTTCCKLQTGEWGCCPLVKAVCCADQEHCCPQGYSCNMQTGTCEKKNPNALTITLPRVKVVRSELGDDEDVPCDVTGKFHCPKRDTCCKVSASEWACCPSARAVCCSDSQRCCPVGYSCDLKAAGCSLLPQLTWDSLIGDRRKDFVPRGL
ncbi:granulin b isoform X1 [Anarrhichthys ocellatus]|uniref:granulin b isoform X1 n=2 Tax=Anarrhichthys ocellatus TaxID=433405 RepID=UPI0012ECBFE1|nr:progranulin-like isoform X1 [Anarrhichthys ocellatus]